MAKIISNEEYAKLTRDVDYWKDLALREESYKNFYEALYKVKKEKVDVIVPLQAEEFPKQRFYARGTTSFSALSRHLNYSQVQDF